MWKFVLGCLLGFCFAGAAGAQAPSQPAIPPGYVLATSGVLNHAQVLAVIIAPESKRGPHCAFFIKPSDAGAKPEWFWIRNDDNAKAMERGEAAGLLMGAAEAYVWGSGDEGPARYVNITYATVDGEKVITAASLGVELSN
jgi:hypothetical protein